MWAGCAEKWDQPGRRKIDPSELSQAVPTGPLYPDFNRTPRGNGGSRWGASKSGTERLKKKKKNSDASMASDHKVTFNLLREYLQVGEDGTWQMTQAGVFTGEATCCLRTSRFREPPTGRHQHHPNRRPGVFLALFP